MENKIINPRFELNLKRTLLVGRPTGEMLTEILANKKESWEYLEDHYAKIIIRLESVTGMNKSFFLGAFGQRVKKLGMEKFREKYEFTGNETIKSDIENEFIIASLLDFPKI